ncbi:magnesium transporter CorA family protein [Paucibacter sp. APW11]|uniref:Magnesium transporter CorA family protein n=1 Tax=Roseateles aquae TaxID=3077235 RepID=A0ABU3PAN1_9BURK|nr:magnesium transporter CorA family protein [Paucibacter sp. APW11]MDT8999634.1 magnesium transporter CorA family protein [Paucibacter sp. APW11]
MRAFAVHPGGFSELRQLPQDLPPEGFVWLSFARAEFEARVPELQASLQHWAGGTLVDLHVSDLLNAQLPSHFDYTSWYDLLVFRRLAASSASEQREEEPAADAMLSSIDTNPVGFAVFDHVLVTVHPDDCLVRDFFAERLERWHEGRDLRGGGRLPSSPAELMLRMVNHMVDSYLELRRQLTRQFSALQRQLLDPHSQFDDWPALQTARDALHRLEDTCEDQRSALQEWMDALAEWPPGTSLLAERERELLRVRSRDVLEHVERVLSHVRRLESSAETAVQMHFSALGHRTNNIMRTLTVLTAIFLPLNLITGIFGMNFDALPLVHKALGFWIAFGLMLAVGLGLGAFFWRKRYLSTRN